VGDNCARQKGIKDRDGVLTLRGTGGKKFQAVGAGKGRGAQAGLGGMGYTLAGKAGPIERVHTATTLGAWEIRGRLL